MECFMATALVPINLFFGMTGSFPSYSLTTLGLKKPGQVIPA
jgi:hypothetical protein